MRYLPYLYESPLFFVQAAMTIWMIVDASRRGVEYYWYWLILAFQPFGAWAYFFVYKLQDFRGGSNRLTGLFHRPPSLDELKHRIAAFFADRFVDVRLLLPHDRGGELSALYASGAPVTDREDVEEGVLVRARLPRHLLARFAAFRVED